MKEQASELYKRAITDALARFYSWELTRGQLESLLFDAAKILTKPKTLCDYQASESNLVQHAYRELELIGGLDTEEQVHMATHILDIVEAFSEEGHSGFSACYALSVLRSVMAFEPVTPLTGEDDEWTEVAEGCFQNKRFSEVFKDGKNAEAYWSQGRVFSDNDGVSWYVNKDSRVPIKFPFRLVDRERVKIRLDHEKINETAEWAELPETESGMDD